MIISKGLSRVGATGLLLALSLAVSAREQVTQTSADIRRTSYGVPHIRASDERGLGVGMGYAYAQDNLCLLANEVVTVNGERARFFGPDQATLEERNNLASDVFFNWLNTPETVAAFWKAQTPEMQQRIEGYVAGYNRYLKDKGAPAQCQAAWVRPLVVQDLVKLTRRLLVEGGIGQFAEALVGAAPPQATASVQPGAKAFAMAAANQQRFTLDRGSNAVAVGRDRSFNGRGMLLANPHFPWVGGMRFYEMHLTIPGQLDVMGAALPGLPVVNIGFNQHVAWTHTVDTSKHFTLYRLTLDPKDATRYLLDGKSIPLDKTAVTVQVKQADGSLKAVTHTVYSSQFGPVVQWPGKLDWDNHYAFSLRDANLGNDRVLQQWYAMNRAGSLKELQTSVHTLQGIPWVNTLAADDQGQSLYMNLSVVPNVSAAKLAKCSDPRAGLQMIMLDGAHSACAWDIDPRAAQPGIFPADQLPQLQRTDYVQHSNDSAWMANSKAPLSGFSPVISQDNIGLGPRARFALQRLQTLEQQPITVTDLQDMVMDNEVYLAGQVMPDLLTFCAKHLGADAAALQPLCTSLKNWDQRANLDSGVGLVHFINLVQHLQQIPDAWRVAFDPAHPLTTPSGLAIDRAPVAKALRAAMLASSAEVSKLGQTRWGDIQVSGQTPIHGGPQELGIYNAMQTVPRADGKREVVSGTSYLQIVSFDDKGPNAVGVLAFSESSNPASAYSKDQTQAFSEKKLRPLPFTEAQIKADPHYQIHTVKE
ncbi:acylase [Pseudomonas sp. PA-1-2A]|uniref:bifunctional acylase PvdQ n=1 Tax=Pseudomonas TaxID=286 RepID=UPI001EEFF61C|nr:MULTISPECIES: acylase [unclassified Pseudomonas]MCF8970020.1 acylase [Pseudomonas carnis]MCF5693397.1 acylase [Pseudomonas sp. PA-1-8C]MCF5787673.1 acylase [Pseudomonas sp. PA-1-6G]MCF5793306.1 acylase [Pseudomonas sp. PA-1-6B]MCF5814434.1 acylase [Pseudomonas sp. PA-1-2A]